MSYLFKIEKVRKFFKILEKQGRATNKRYLGWDKNNPNITYCEKQVFVSRMSNRLLPSKYLKVYNISNKTVKYIYVLRVDYYLGHGEELEVYYLDYGNINLGIQSKKMGWNDIYCLEGEFSDEATFSKILNMFKLELPLKTYRFLAYDFDKYPKRVRKGTDLKEKIKTFVDVEAITTEDALSKRKEYNVGKLMITEEFEIL